MPRLPATMKLNQRIVLVPICTHKSLAVAYQTPNIPDAGEGTMVVYEVQGPFCPTAIHAPLVSTMYPFFVAMGHDKSRGKATRGRWQGFGYAQYEPPLIATTPHDFSCARRVG